MYDDNVLVYNPLHSDDAFLSQYCFSHIQVFDSSIVRHVYVASRL